MTRIYVQSPLVVVESPYAERHDRHEHPWCTTREYVRACLLDVLERNEAPFASHALYTEILDDTTPRERVIGIDAGLSWAARADVAAFYLDLGWSSGMRAALPFYAQFAPNVRIEERTLGEGRIRDLIARCSVVERRATERHLDALAKRRTGV